MTANDFDLFTTLRVDPALEKVPETNLSHAGWNYHNASPIYMLDYHRDRLLRAALHWNWQAAVDALIGQAGLEKLQAYITTTTHVTEKPGSLRVKVTVGEDGTFNHVAASVPDVPLSNLFPSALPPPTSMSTIVSRDPEFMVLLDGEKTSSSDFTHYKTTYRPMYDAARARAGIHGPEMKEVLTINRADGSIMEGSITTPYFWRNDRWVTPPVSSKYDDRSGSGGNDGTTRRWALERNIAVEEVVRAESLVDGEQCWLSNGLKGFVAGKIAIR